MTFRSKTRLASKQNGIAPIVALVALNVMSVAIAALMLLGFESLPPAVSIHGALMLIAWGCFLPLGGIVARYFKVTPAQEFPSVVDNLFWWHCHRTFQYSGALIALIALVVILRHAGGYADSLHARLGLGVMAFVALQVASPLFRGSKGGPTGEGARADDPRTWRGDHYDMTRRRRLFETWHKPVGWILLVLAQLTLFLGAALAGVSDWVLGLIGLIACTLLLAIGDSSLRGRWISTNAALWGPAWARTPLPDQSWEQQPSSDR